MSPPSSETGTASRSASACLTMPTVPPSHHWMSAAVPGPNVPSQRRTISAQPSAAGHGSGTSPSQAAMDVHCGRDTRQCPPLRPRVTSPSTPSWVSTRGDIATLAP